MQHEAIALYLPPVHYSVALVLAAAYLYKSYTESSPMTHLFHTLPHTLFDCHLSIRERCSAINLLPICMRIDYAYTVGIA